MELVKAKSEEIRAKKEEANARKGIADSKAHEFWSKKEKTRAKNKDLTVIMEGKKISL